MNTNLAHTAAGKKLLGRESAGRDGNHSCLPGDFLRPHCAKLWGGSGFLCSLDRDLINLGYTGPVLSVPKVDILIPRGLLSLAVGIALYAGTILHLPSELGYQNLPPQFQSPTARDAKRFLKVEMYIKYIIF